ncbi:MAG: hypothetical protein R3E84_08195 [Pseudomonadales bacterium]
MRVLRTVLAVAVVLAGGCAIPKLGKVQGGLFEHVVLAPRAQPRSQVIHLYIGGDGRPFVTPDRVATDPTPARSMVTRWLQADTTERYVLGRPCYHGLAGDPSCAPRWWTTQRYARPVVDSLVLAAQGLTDGRPVVLIGYSGGGTLAVMMAARLSNAVGVVTVAANLAPDAWTDLHGYTPVAGNADVEHALTQLSRMPQLHFAGGHDQNVPVSINRGLYGHLPAGTVCVMPGFDHTCCWSRRWKRVLAAIADWRCETAGGQVWIGTAS